MCQIHIRHVGVLSFGELGMTGSEYNMIQSSADVVDEQSTFQFVWLSYKHA